MFSKAKQLNIPRSYFSPIPSDTYTRRTPVDLISVSDSSPSTGFPPPDAPSSPHSDVWSSEEGLEDSRKDKSPSFSYQDAKTDFG